MASFSEMAATPQYTPALQDVGCRRGADSVVSHATALAPWRGPQLHFIARHANLLAVSLLVATVATLIERSVQATLPDTAIHAAAAGLGLAVGYPLGRGLIQRHATLLCAREAWRYGEAEVEEQRLPVAVYVVILGFVVASMTTLLLCTAGVTSILLLAFGLPLFEPAPTWLAWNMVGLLASVLATWVGVRLLRRAENQRSFPAMCQILRGLIDYGHELEVKWRV